MILGVSNESTVLPLHFPDAPRVGSWVGPARFDWTLTHLQSLAIVLSPPLSFLCTVRCLPQLIRVPVASEMQA